MVSNKQKLELANSVGEILPLDPESCNQMIEYALTLKDEQEIRAHFLNMLGESEATDKFLTEFIQTKKNPKSKHQPASIPTQPIPKDKKDLKNPWNNTQSSQQGGSSSNSSKGQGSSFSSKSKTPKTVSELVKDKQPEPPKENRKSKKKTLESLKDLESLLNSLEVSHSKDTRTVCYCNATRHPLFDIAPNCLNCGKIICSKEGLQPCSFCGNELLSSKDKKDIEKVLLQEKIELEKGRTITSPKPSEIQEEIPKSQKSKKIVVSMNAGENLWKAQEKALKQAEEEKKLQHDQLEAEKLQQELQAKQQSELQYYERLHGSNKDLIEAQERLDRLLQFQETGEERTKIIDNAADYELSSSNNTGNMWLSATERALRLKKQQKHLRKHEEAEQKRIGKGKRNVEMVIKDGKVRMVERYSSPQEDIEEDKDIQELEGKLKENQKASEQQMTQNFWDFENDKHKWEKPVYVSNDNNNDNKTNNAKTHEEILRKRVQLSGGKDQTELIASMY